MYEYCVRIRRSNEEREWLCIRFDRRTIAVLLATRHTLHMPTLGIRFNEWCRFCRRLAFIEHIVAAVVCFFLHNGKAYEVRATSISYTLPS